MNHNHEELIILEVNEQTQDKAKEIILEGMCEHWGFIDYTLNPDLDNIIANYIQRGDIFHVGSLQGEVVCTGAFIKEDDDVVRIVRMSVAKPYRRKGFANQMINKLEETAHKKGYKKIVLETNKEWSNAIKFYTACGYREYSRDSTQVHMEKSLLEMTERDEEYV